MFTCMDTRLVELATKSLNLSQGDVKVVKNAGAIRHILLDLLCVV